MPTMTKRPRHLLLLLVCAATLSACGSLLESDQPPASRWWLEPVAPAAPGVPTLVTAGYDELVLDLSVVPGLDTDRILNLDRQARLNHYAGAYWPDHLPEVLASVLARSFEAHGRLRVRAGDRAPAGACLLRLEARSFYGRLDGGVTGRVEIAFAGTLSCGDAVEGLTTRIQQPVAANRMTAIVTAFQEGLARAIDDLSAQFAAP